MFIYEKNKRNSETGKLEQTLNITFEGNKPVENPDVIINKDGVEGIKSDSNAYIVDVRHIDTTIISSFSIDGEIVTTDSSEYVFEAIAKRYVGFNLLTANKTFTIFNLYHNSIFEQYSIDIDIIGEYIIDFKEQTLKKPNGETITLLEPTTSIDIVSGVRFEQWKLY